MNKEDLERFQHDWEPKDCEVVRTIDVGVGDDTVERIIRVGTVYSLYRYFTFGDNPTINVSVDLNEVDADHVIQYLAERL